MASCYACTRYWYHAGETPEGGNDGSAGHVCDGLQRPGIVNLKTFPFRRAPERCFQPRATPDPSP